MSLWSRISNAVRGERLNREIEEELQSHIEEAIASGRDPDEARRAFGSILRQREATLAHFTVTLHLGHDYVPCGPRLRHVGHDHGSVHPCLKQLHCCGMTPMYPET
jgi:hypothetical protein